MECSKEQHLFVIEIFCNTLNVFTVQTLDISINTSLLNKSMHSPQTKQCTVYISMYVIYQLSAITSK